VIMNLSKSFKIFNTYRRKFGFIKTFLKLASYEFSILSSHIGIGNQVVDLGGGEGLLSAFLRTKNTEAKFQVVDSNETFLNFLVTNQDILSLDVKRMDMMDLDDIPEADIYILNDVMHHLPLKNHEKLLKSLLQEKQKTKKIIIRDVIKGKNLDYFLTKNIDKRLYPNDPLEFREFNEWIALLKSLPAKKYEFKKHCKGWPSNKFQMVIWK